MAKGVMFLENVTIVEPQDRVSFEPGKKTLEERIEAIDKAIKEIKAELSSIRRAIYGSSRL